ncbi:MAG: hypothetical protein ACOZAN_01395 [Patescibacteria group bacterium]
MSPTTKPISSTTQEFLDIHDITNNIVILKDASAAMILRVSAMNFGLLAEEEQDAVIYTYAALLNSLNYPIQIIIQSQTKDASSYLKLLEQQENKATNSNKKGMIARYRKFVSELIKEHNVLDKKFYVVVPATGLEMGFISPQSVVPGNKGFDVNSIEKTTIVEKALSILEPRRDHLLGQFGRIGLFAYQLETQEIIRVFYNNYNPGSIEGQQITDTNNYTTAMVRASVGGIGQNSTNYQDQYQSQAQQVITTDFSQGFPYPSVQENTAQTTTQEIAQGATQESISDEQQLTQSQEPVVIDNNFTNQTPQSTTEQQQFNTTDPSQLQPTPTIQADVVEPANPTLQTSSTSNQTNPTNQLTNLNQTNQEQTVFNSGTLPPLAEIQ